MARASRSKGAEAQAQRYKSNKQQEVNRKRKLLKQLKLQPTNEQVKLALKDIRYRRKTPGANGWRASEIAVAKLFAEFGGKFDRAFFHPDPKVSQAFLQVQSPIAADVASAKSLGTTDKNFFALITRNNLRVKA